MRKSWTLLIENLWVVHWEFHAFFGVYTRIGVGRNGRKCLVVGGGVWQKSFYFTDIFHGEEEEEYVICTLALFVAASSLSLFNCGVDLL